MSKPVRLLLVDDHPIVRTGLRMLFQSEPDMVVVGEVNGGAEAIEAMQSLHPDVVIMDVAMPGMNGLDLIRRIRSEHPGVAVLVLSMHAEEQYAMRSFRAGASGYLTKDSAAEELVRAVRKIAAGGTYVSASLAERVVRQLNGADAAPRHARLSDRELEVLRRIVSGERLTDIARALHLSVKTISTHKTRILEKLEIASTAGLVRYGLEHGLGDAAAPRSGGAPT